MSSDVSAQDQSAVIDQQQNKIAKPGLLINRNFALLVVGQAISQFGDFVFTLTLVVWVATKVAPASWAPLAVSCIMFSIYIPSILLGPWVGVFVDRWQHRQTMIRIDCLRACLIIILLLFTGIVLPLWHISAVSTVVIVCSEVFLESTCSLFFNPANTGLIGQIVPQEQQPQAQGRSQALYAIAKLIGPLLGPILYFAVGILWCLLIDAVSFLVSIITLWTIHVALLERRPQEQSGGFWREFVQGISFSFQDRVLRVLIISNFVIVLGIGSFDSLFLFFMQRNLHTAVSLSGVLVAAMAVGTIIGALIFGNAAHKIGLVRLLWSSIIACGLFLALFSRLTNFSLGLLAIFLVGFTMSAMSVTIGPILLRRSPVDLVGRVSAVMGSLSMVGTTLSTTMAGFLASVVLASLHVHLLGTSFGPIDTIFFSGACLFMLSGFYVFFTLRKTQLVGYVAKKKADIV
jgi:MFS family permease